MCAAALRERESFVLGVLGTTPFATAAEIAALGGVGLRWTRRGLNSLRDGSFVDFVNYTRAPASHLRRWHLTRSGVRLLAEVEGTSPARLMARLPISLEWQRSLLRRIDALDILYLLFTRVTGVAGTGCEWTWYRDGAFDAGVRLPDGRAFVVIRLGSTLSWQATKSRLGSLHSSQNKSGAPPALVIVPGEIEVHRIMKFMRNRAVDMYLAPEDALSEQSAAWRSCEYMGGDKLLGDVLKDMRVRRRLPVARRYERETLPGLDIQSSVESVNLDACALSPVEKRMLRLLYDWPLVTNEDLSEALDISDGRMKEPRAALVGRDLVVRVEIGNTFKARAEAGSRLALSDRGRRCLAWADRRRPSELAAHWQVTPCEEGHPQLKVRGHRLDGSKVRTLVREMSHTDAVSRLAAMLSSESRRHSSYEMVEALPPHRWDRTFRYNGRRAVVRPDATFALNYRGQRQFYLIEYEERANAPSRMRPKIAAYERYYGATDTRGDFEGTLPRTLFIFAEREKASAFARFASRVRRERLPILVSSMDVLRDTGVFGDAWTFPWELEYGRMQLAMFGRRSNG